jgi:MFS family permease
MSEVLFLLMMPWFFRKLGIKWVMMLGLIAWSLRYALFALGAPDAVVWMMIAGILLHGACYDFVYVASQLYIDKQATPQIRAQAQGFFVLISYGIGQGLGALTSGWIYNVVMGGDASASLSQWQTFWLVPLIFSVVVTVLFAFGFKETK